MSFVIDRFDAARGWLIDHAALSWWLVAGSVLFSLVGMLVVRRFVLALPADYFTRPSEPGERWRDRHPVSRWILLIGKNLIGGLLLVLGLTMLVAPGPGIVTLLLALVLLDLPGKRTLEHRLATLPSVLHTINRIRERSGQPPIEAPPAR